MKVERALVLCLVADLALLIIERTVKVDGAPWRHVLTGLRVLAFLLTLTNFLVWVVKTYSAIISGPERVARELERQAGRQAAERRQEALDEERRLRRNARQRARRAEIRAQENARAEMAQENARLSERRAKINEQKPKPATTTEPKSRWDRILEDDDEAFK
jgi:cell shape-determining protein MreC